MERQKPEIMVSNSNWSSPVVIYVKISSRETLAWSLKLKFFSSSNFEMNESFPGCWSRLTPTGFFTALFLYVWFEEAGTIILFDLQDPCNDRRSALEESLKFHQFKFQIEAEIQWISDHRPFTLSAVCLVMHSITYVIIFTLNS